MLKRFGDSGSGGALLADAQPFEYQSEALSEDVTELAARGVGMTGNEPGGFLLSPNGLDTDFFDANGNLSAQYHESHGEAHRHNFWDGRRDPAHLPMSPIPKRQSLRKTPMKNETETYGWGLARNGFSLPRVIGSYPSFHDSAVQSFLMQRTRTSRLDDDGHPLFPGCERDFVDLTLEILHNRYGPQNTDGCPDYVVVVKLMEIISGEIDINAMIEEAWIREIKLSREDNGLITFDLNPNLGLNIVLTCREVVIDSIKPYYRQLP
ncbi:hypothetical protein AWB78_07187 [Caballeronia calidae]|uniref:Uncharacterized protein n=1 Tax=Caballeronia calidae TaxID=1777139 RepID=A0A158EDD9_9BURK|nr:Imm50 family immunity protein [Caballeronia calidae]SAL04901.1 hypothetical protein AWB78_07187 [Caballeronia calidae]